MGKFSNKYFDEGKFKKELQEYDDIEACLKDALDNFRNEGIPTDYDFLVRLSRFNDEDYLGYIKEAHKNYINSLGLLPKAERKRIAKVYDEMYTNTLQSFQRVKNSFKKGLVISKGENNRPIIDRKKMEAETKKRVTFAVDAEKMEEYYNLIMNIKDAMAKAGEFEEKHGLYRFSDGETKLIYQNPYYPDFICELTLPKYFKEGNCNDEYFEKMMNQFFRRDKK